MFLEVSNERRSEYRQRAARKRTICRDLVARHDASRSNEIAGVFILFFHFFFRSIILLQDSHHRLIRDSRRNTGKYTGLRMSRVRGTATITVIDI